MKRYKSIYSLLLVFSLALPFCGVYLWFQGQIYLSQEDGRSHTVDGVEWEQLVVFTFSISDSDQYLEWEHSHEFAYEDEMYDIIKFECFILKIFLA